jgi:tellurite resistance protein TerC
VLLFWIFFNLFVIAMLALDLGVLRRRSREVSFRESLIWSGIWIALACSFGAVVFFWHGRAEALQFITGYVIELSLSVDNLFVFLVIFRYFKVAGEHQHKVLFWGILGALAMRGVFIATGVGLIERFDWIMYAFGAFLIYSGVKLLGAGDKQIHPEKNPVVRMARRFLPVTAEYKGDHFFVRSVTGLCATPLFIVLLVVETTDVLLAVDSIPAVLAITLNAFIVYTSNVFAILGLRSMYFALAGMMDMFHYLHYGLSVVLIFMGLKMIGAHYVNVPTEWALGTVILVLATSVVASLVNPKKAAP